VIVSSSNLANDPVADESACHRAASSHQNGACTGAAAADESTADANSNGQSTSAASSSSGPSHTERAEEMVDRIAERVGQFTSVWGRKLSRAAARIKEEAQDLWAEAQSIRRGDQP
jgi:hypothetical protein